MAGIKGQSGGKALTAEDKAKKAAATAAREAKRREKLSAPAVLDPRSEDPKKRLGLPLTWGDELKRRQVEGETIQNKRRQVEVSRAEVELQRAKDEAQEARGKLVERSELDRLAAKIRDAWWREVQQVGPQSLLKLADLSAEIRARVKDVVAAEVIAAAERVKAAITA